MGSSDERELVRARLDAIAGTTGELPRHGRGPDVSSGGDPEFVDETFADGPFDANWLPSPRLSDRLVAARWDTGRRGTVALASVGIVAALVALVVVWRDRPVPEPVPPLPTVEVATVAASTPAPVPEPAELVVSVVGLVATPGLVQLDAGARVADALDAAGGAVAGADLVGLNLAQRVADGDQIVVGSAPPQQVPEGSAVSGTGGGGDAPGGSGTDPNLVNLNSADEAALDALPGVGPVTAASIVSWRRENGAFTDVEQLGEVDGIGPARLARLRDLVTV